MTTGVTTGPYRVDQGNTEWFGDADYKKILADAASNNQDLQAVRNGVLEWLESDDGRSKYRGNNDGSDPYGRNTFYDRIKWPTINAAFGNYAGGSEEKDYFGDEEEAPMDDEEAVLEATEVVEEGEEVVEEAPTMDEDAVIEETMKRVMTRLQTMKKENAEAKKHEELIEAVAAAVEKRLASK